MQRKIFIVRNEQPEEVSAFFLAKKVTESLIRMGFNAELKTISFSQTYMSCFKQKAIRELQQLFDTARDKCLVDDHMILDPSEFLIRDYWFKNNYQQLREGITFTFHNYPKGNCLSSDYSRFGKLWYIVEPLCLRHNLSNVTISEEKDILYGEMISVIEIPAICKFNIIEPEDRRDIRICCSNVVDFIATKRSGLVDEKMMKQIINLMLKIMNP